MRRRAKARSGPGRLGIWAAAPCAAFLIGSAACAAEPPAPPPQAANAALFSWSAETVNKTDGALFSLMRREGLNVLYQTFSTDNSRQEQMAAFLEMALEEGIQVYLLDGDPSWALDPEGAALCEAVEDAAAYNRRTRRKFLAWREEDGKPWQAIPRLTGVILDVEPYALEEWAEDPASIMESFVSGMEKAYALAQEHDLEVILCIPWFYENKGQQEGLEQLVARCCDSIAVMNYYRGSEIENIALEAELARKYKKGLITIYELQPADGKSIKEVNTYHSVGLASARENYDCLTQAYPEQFISLAFHNYQALKGDSGN